MPSTVIRDCSHDPVTKTLFITFASGELYAYLEVPRAVFEGLRAAGSRGRYFAYKIRNRFRYRRMGPDGDGEMVSPAGPASRPPAGAAR